MPIIAEDIPELLMALEDHLRNFKAEYRLDPRAWWSETSKALVHLAEIERCIGDLRKASLGTKCRMATIDNFRRYVADARLTRNDLTVLFVYLDQRLYKNGGGANE